MAKANYYCVRMKKLSSAQKYSFAKALRKRMTPQEKILWEELRRHSLYGLKFKRQVPMGNYVVDFYCHKYRLIIEIDGSIHEEQKEYDALREEVLKQRHCKILRFTNDQIDRELPVVLKTIINSISPSPQTRS